MSIDQGAATNTDRGTGWGQNRRLEFIDFRLLWEGRINRGDLTDFFGISVPQASLDLARYQEMAPDNVEYDRKERVYVATPKFEPLITTKDSSRYLNSVLAVNLGMMSREMSFVGSYPSFDAILSPTRHIDSVVLMQILHAIRRRWALSIEYQSFRRPEPTIRTISPHAIAYDGFRWHTRAYCHENKDFRDFVFARILKVISQTDSTSDAGEDAAWSNFLNVKLEPHPGLPSGQRKAIELDYGMTNGIKVVEVRQALLFYMLKRLGLDEPSNKSAQARQVVLANFEELRPYMPRSN